VAYAWAGFGAAFGPVVLISVLWKGMTRNGALAGIVVGALTVILWKQFDTIGLYEIIPGFLFASIAIVVVSKLSSPSSSMVSRFETADAAYHAEK
jgi:sodium/proline symporter